MNSIEKKEIIRKAKVKAQHLKQLRKDPRYLQVIGRLKHEGLLEADVLSHRRKFLIEEALWVGEHIEPRVFELLPAIVIKRPGMMLFEKLPEDLRKVVNAIKRGQPTDRFRNIDISSYSQWIPNLGRKGKYPKATKTFRFDLEDLDRLRKLSIKMGLNETETIRSLLRNS